jgi:hypothetical protein
VLAPLGLRLKAKEIQYCLDQLKSKAYFFLGKTAVAKIARADNPYTAMWCSCGAALAVI